MKPSEAKEALALLWFILGCGMSIAESSMIPWMLKVGAVFCIVVGFTYVWASWQYARVEGIILRAHQAAHDEAMKKVGKK